MYVQFIPLPIYQLEVSCTVHDAHGDCALATNLTQTTGKKFDVHFDNEIPHIVIEVSKQSWELLHSKLFHFANSCTIRVIFSLHFGSIAYSHR